MKCPYCSAEVRGKFCEYCGSEMPKEEPAVNITNNYFNGTPEKEENNSAANCPRCGHSQITFKRERASTFTNSNSYKNLFGTGRNRQSVSQANYRTVGICQNCGYTWDPNTTNTGPRSKTWLWVLGWIFIFPVPLTILMLRNKEMKPAVKYGIIAGAWLLFLIIGLSGGGENDVPNSDTTITESTTQENQITITSGTDISPEKLSDMIDSITVKYNSRSTEQLSFLEDFTPQDKNSSHYRTEFRLTAYNDAIGKSYLLGDKMVDIIASPDIFGDVSFRVYTNDVSLEQAIALVQGMSPILDETLSANDLAATITEISDKKTANGYYYGELGITLFGDDNKGYELMIKTD